MKIEPGSRLLHYGIVEKIGEGGMGQVYRATDTKLGREVAIKTLPPHVSTDPERLARFQREAQVLASLNHPNIAAIYGVEEVEGTHFLVLELVEGPDLAERLAQGTMPVAEVLDTARQIAGALEAAHERGIVHRDLKPANVKRAADGMVKVLDFGLAKAFEGGAPGEGDPSLSPTITSASTRAGMILGTAAYMSPEQARGATVDKRSDIWSFGCVLLELLTGRNPFVEDTISDTLASVLRSEPDLETLPGDAPARLKRLVRRCLEKDPLRRLRDIGEARIALDAVAAGEDETNGAPEAAPASSRRPWALLFGAVLVTAVVTALVVLSLEPPTPQRLPRRFEALDGPFQQGKTAPPEISPDGHALVFARDDALWVRRLDQLEPQRLEGTEGASKPAWSPDSQSIAFVVQGNLKSIPATGGAVSTIAIGVGALNEVGDLDWGPDGRLAISSGDGGLLDVAARGGDVRTVLAPDGDVEDDFHEFTYLPDGSIVYVVHRSGTGADTLALLVDGKSRYLFTLDAGRVNDPVYSPTGHLLYRRSQTQSGLWAVPFSLDRLELTGEAFLVDPDASAASIADDGTLLYVSGNADALGQLVWVDRDGRIDEKPVGQPLESIASPALSPDGKRVAVMGREGEQGNIWILDLERGTRSRLTFGTQADWDPTWSVDGRDIIFWEGDTRAISRKAADGTGGTERIVKVELRDSGIPSISDDGKWMAFWVLPQGKVSGDIWYQPFGEDAEPKPIVDTDFNEDYAQLSRDGRFLVYASDESGRREVYLTRFPSGDGRWQVSVDGGIQPRWSVAGDEIFYVDGTELKAVSVATEPSVLLGTPQTLFDFAATGISVADPKRYEVSRDARRFLMVQSVREQEEEASLVLAYDWFQPFE